MKKKFLLAFSAMFILALTVAAFAFTQSNNSNETAADSCAMMKDLNAQSADGQPKMSCCDKDDCCCKGDSCPMKNQGENASASCCSCCDDSCPMKNKESASAVDAKTATIATGENCYKHKRK